MSLQERLSETLRDRAETVLPPAGLATRAAARGRALRRRRRMAVAAAPLVAVMAVVAGTAAVTGRDERAVPPMPARPVEVPPGPEPARPYAVPLDPDGTRNYGSLHFGTTDVALPDLWDPAELWPAGDGVVVGVHVQPNEQWREQVELDLGSTRLAYVDARGSIHQLPGLAWPAAVSPDGRRLAAVDEADESRLIEVELPSGRRLNEVSGRLTPLAYVASKAGEYRLLAVESIGAADMTGDHTEELRIVHDGKLDRMPGVAAVSEVDAGIGEVATGGRVVGVMRADRLDVYRLPPAGEGLAWSRPVPAGTGAEAAIQSPDGHLFAIAEGQQVVVVDADDGREVSRTPALGYTVESFSWEGPGHVIVDRTEGTGYVAASRCDAATGRCEPYRGFEAVRPD